MSIYSLTGLQSATEYDSGTDTTSPLQASLDVPAGGVVIATSYLSSTDDATWTNVTADYEITQSGAKMESASASFDNPQFALNVQATQGGSPAFCAASWGPD